LPGVVMVSISDSLLLLFVTEAVENFGHVINKQTNIVVVEVVVVAVVVVLVVLVV
jgi:hypothetical protein